MEKQLSALVLLEIFYSTSWSNPDKSSDSMNWQNPIIPGFTRMMDELATEHRCSLANYIGHRSRLITNCLMSLDLPIHDPQYSYKCKKVKHNESKINNKFTLFRLLLHLCFVTLGLCNLSHMQGKNSRLIGIPVVLTIFAPTVWPQSQRSTY